MMKAKFTGKTMLMACAIGSFGVTVSPAAADEPVAPSAASDTSEPQQYENDVAAEVAQGEIVVTAQRRAERLQDVPISITAIGGEAMAQQRIISGLDIQRVSPSIAFKMTNTPIAGASIQIRGIGTTGQSRSFEGAVGVFIDGVYRTRSGQALQNFLDMDSLQILRGPQGTLFGKNTSAGALLLTSNAPSTSEVSGKYEVAVGNYDYYLIRGAVNVPLSDKAAVRVAVLQTDRDGFFRNVNGWRDNESRDRAIKAQILLEPSDSLSLRLIGDYARSKGNCCYGAAEAIDGPLTSYLEALTLAAGRKLPTSNDFQSWNNLEGSADTKDYGGTLLADWDLGDTTVRSITALRRYTVVQNQTDADYTGADIASIDETFRSKFFSQELSLSGSFGEAVGVNYVLGAFYSNEKIAIPRTGYWGTQAQPFFDRLFSSFGLAPGTAIAPAAPYLEHILNQKAESVAGFAHLEVELSEHWNVIGGLRYSKERKEAQVDGIPLGNLTFDPFAIFGVMPVKSFQTTSKDNALSGTLGIQYKFDRNAMVYASYNRGFKAGGVVLDVTGSGTFASQLLPNIFGAVVNDPIYKPETIDAFELGAKVTWLGGRATTNVAAFYNSIHDLQIGQFLGVRFNVINSDRAKVYGAEFEQRFQLAEGLNLTAAATWLPEANFGTEARLGVISGRRLSTAPKFASSIALGGERPVSNFLVTTASIQVQYTGAVFTTNTSNARQGAYALINGNVGLKSRAGGWTIEAFVNNLSDKRYIVQHFATPLQSGDQNAYVGAPRTFGLAVRGSF